MLILLGVIVVSFLLALNWHKLPFWNVLKKDLSNSWVKLDTRQFRLSGLKDTTTTFEEIPGSEKIYISKTYDMYDPYNSKQRSFTYKALAQEKKLGFYKFYVVLSSEVKENLDNKQI